MGFRPKKGCFHLLEVPNEPKLALPACGVKNASILSLKFLDNNKDWRMEGK